ncbi:asparagine synthase-related protein [Yoonia vestfoldensis]|uniref:asparagine synthase-related protein n=1 Tax=Yoonia vestfoldensis TaxID=245188 RepID=UPI0003647B42|nr:asparagine synthase C-terminal domain-containing protein [Yoonia vestfoldensis]
MLSFRLDAGDLRGKWGVDWRHTGDRLVAAQSEIIPFANPMLQHLLILSPHTTCLIVRERGAGNAPKAAPAEIRINDADLHRVVSRYLRWPLQLTLLLVDHRTGSVRLFAGQGGNAPVYLLEKGDVLLGHWDPQHLIPEVRKIDIGSAARFLRDFDMPYGPQTFYPDLHVLTEESTLDWRPGRGLRAVPPKPHPQPRSAALDPAADPVEIALDILSSALARSLPADVLVGTELSGGLDSALVSIIASRKQPGLQSFGLNLPGMPGQSERRDAVIARFGLKDHTRDLAMATPLFPGSPRWQGAGGAPWEETYDEAVGTLLAQAADLGIRAMLTGFGGDELCSLYPGEAPPPPHLAPLEPASETPCMPDFLTPSAQQALDRHRPVVAPRAALDSSALETVAFGAAVYMRHGIWPVHPLCSRELVRFCAMLPWDWRVGRRIEREMLRALDCPDLLAGCRHVDSFLPALATGFRTGSFDRIQALFADARIVRIGLVDQDRLQNGFAAWRNGGHDDAVLPYYSAACLELSLQRAGLGT